MLGPESTDNRSCTWYLPPQRTCPAHLGSARHTAGTSSAPDNLPFLAFLCLSELGRDRIAAHTLLNRPMENVRGFLKVGAGERGQDGRTILPPTPRSVLQTTAALFGEGEKIPFGTSAAVSGRTGQEQRSAGKVTSSSGAEVLEGQPCLSLALPSRAGRAGGGRAPYAGQR